MISLHNMLPFELTKDTPYLALSGELWSVFYEYSKTPHQRPPRGRPPRLNGHFFWHRFIFFVNFM